MPPRPKPSPRAKPRVEPEAPRSRRRLALEERRAQLVELGIEAFSGAAYDEVGVDEVATRAGISKGLLYHYFPTKRDFYVAAIREVSRRLLDATQTSAELSPLERMRTGLQAYFHFVERHGAAYAALLRGGIGADEEAIRVIDDTRRVFVERLVESIGFASVTPLVRTTMRGWVGFVEATSLDWAEQRDVPADELLGLWSRTLVGLVTPLIAGGDAA